MVPSLEQHPWYHHCVITAPALHQHCTSTAPSLHHHCTITVLSLPHPSQDPLDQLAAAKAATDAAVAADGAAPGKTQQFVRHGVQKISVKVKFASLGHTQATHIPLTQLIASQLSIKWPLNFMHN